MELFEHGKGIAIHGWHFRIERGPIESSAELDRLEGQLGKKLPGMVYTTSYVDIDGKPSSDSASKAGFRLKFEPVGALRGVGALDPTIQVQAAKDWAERRSHKDVQTLEDPSDWTFTTSYGGEIVSGVQSVVEETEKTINYDLLKRRDIPVLYFNETVLFEDELDDNGAASYVVRMRVSGQFFLVLSRFWLRVDGVIARVYETRFYHEFGQGSVIREWKRQQVDISNTSIPKEKFRDPETAIPHMTVLEHKRDELILEGI